MTGAACGTGNAYHSGAPDFPSVVFIEVHVVLSVICVSSFHLILVFWILSFDYSFCVIAWYLSLSLYIYFLLVYILYTYEYLKC